MKKKNEKRMQSDRAASNTVETIIIITLAVFPVLALFTFMDRKVKDLIKKHTQNTGEEVEK